VRIGARPPGSRGRRHDDALEQVVAPVLSCGDVDETRMNPLNGAVLARFEADSTLGRVAPSPVKFGRDP
jgi:hypothetical protein